MPDISTLLGETSLIVLLFHAVLAPATAIHATLYKRDSRAAFGWIALCVLLPIAGPILYAIAGVNRVRSRAGRLGLPSLDLGYERGARRVIRIPEVSGLPDIYRELARIGGNLSRHRLVEGNHARALHNGEAAYPAMLEAIDAAERFVFLTTYILDSDRTGQAFIDALGRAAGRGVDVRVIIDGFGELYSFPRASRRLRKHGVAVAQFLPPRLFPPQLSINMRNHHKILVVDGRRAYTGGMNIGDRHLAEDRAVTSPVIDLQFELDGPVAVQLAEEFLRTWTFARGSRDSPDLPVTSETGPLVCRTVVDGPDENLDRLTMLLTGTIAQARKRIHIMTPYFLPPREIIGVLQAASLRGVEVNLVLPEKNNLPYVHWATRNMLWELLYQDVKVYYQPPPFVHTKLFVVDGIYALIGSTNWDPRSLRLNFELQVEIFGREFAGEMEAHIRAAIDRGRPVTLEEVDGRSLPIRLRDSVCWLFSPYL